MKVIQVTYLISVFFLSTSLQSAPISERFAELDKEFTLLIDETDKCIHSMQINSVSAYGLHACKEVVKLEEKDIQRLKKRFNKQLNRYKKRKNKLSEEERVLTKKYVTSISQHAKELQKNIHTIFKK